MLVFSLVAGCSGDGAPRAEPPSASADLLGVYGDLIREMTSARFQRVTADEAGLTAGPLPASRRSGSHSVVTERTLSGQELARLRRALLDPESWGEREGSPLSERPPVRVVVAQAGERLLKLAVFAESTWVRFSDDGVHAAVERALSEEGRAALDGVLR